MHRRRPQLCRRVVAVVVAAGLGVGAGGCGRPQPAEDGEERAVVLLGSSSSFAAQAYFRWFNQLAVRENVNSELAVMGSAASIRSFLAGQVHFAGTDTAPSAQEIASAPRGMLAFPVTGGAIAVAYNLPGCNLRLSRRQLVGLFLGRITDFSQLGCRAQPITVLHRGDPSGTTANFTASLAAMGDDWRRGPGVGRSVRWPVGRSVTGTDGMAEALASIPGAVGPIESSYLRAPLQAAALETRQGTYLKPDGSSATPALAGIRLDRHLLGSDPDPSSGYPLVSLHWMLVPARGLGERLPALRRGLDFILSPAGQDDAELLGYLPLPAAMRSQALEQLSRLAP